MVTGRQYDKKKSEYQNQEKSDLQSELTLVKSEVISHSMNPTALQYRPLAYSQGRENKILPNNLIEIKIYVWKIHVDKKDASIFLFFRVVSFSIWFHSIFGFI